MLCDKEELKIYKKYVESIKNNMILPYDKELLFKLNTHKNKNIKMNSYLSSLCSENSIGKNIIYTRYLMLFLNKKEYKLYDGYLSNFKKKFNHSWIENDKYVYDVTFIGKWPKNLFYEVFNPVINEEINLEKDIEYNLAVKNNIEVSNTLNEMEYIDWYSYMKNNTLNTRAISEPLTLKKFKHE